VRDLPTNRSDRAADYLSLTVAGQWRLRTAFPCIPRLLVRVAEIGNQVEYSAPGGEACGVAGNRRCVTAGVPLGEPHPLRQTANKRKSKGKRQKSKGKNVWAGPRAGLGRNLHGLAAIKTIVNESILERRRRLATSRDLRGAQRNGPLAVQRGRPQPNASVSGPCSTPGGVSLRLAAGCPAGLWPSRKPMPT